MDKLKKIISFWPFIFYIGACVLLGFGIANNEFKEDPVWASIIYFEILFPLCAFFLSVWFSIKVKSKKKWSIVLFFWITSFIALVASYSFENFDFASNFVLSFSSAIPSAVGVLLGGQIVRIKEKKKLKGIKNVIFNIICIIVLYFVFFYLQAATVIFLGTVTMGIEAVEEKIEAKPKYTHEMPKLYEVIDEFKVPTGYIKENHGGKEPFENILRESNQDEVLMSIEVVEYAGLDKINLQDVVRFNVYEDASRTKANKWIKEAEISTNNGTKIYKKGHEAVLYREGTYIHATLDIGTLKVTEEDEKAFDEIVNSIRIKEL